MLSYHDGRLGVDLPLHIRFLDARRHDSGIVTLKEFRDLNPEISIRNLCFDSANDNYPTYNLCKAWNIRPFIDLNANRGKPKSIPDKITIQRGMSAFIHQLLEAHGNTKKFTKIAHPVNGQTTAS